MLLAGLDLEPAPLEFSAGESVRPGSHTLVKGHCTLTFQSPPSGHLSLSLALSGRRAAPPTAAAGTSHVLLR